MQLIGTKDRFTQSYYILGYLNTNFNTIKQPIKFTISITTKNTNISYKDAISIGLDLSKLKDEEPQNKYVMLPRKIIPEGSIIFMSATMKTGVIEFFRQISVDSPTITSVKDMQDYSLVPSVLGRDILKGYKITLQEDYIILEK